MNGCIPMNRQGKSGDPKAWSGSSGGVSSGRNFGEGVYSYGKLSYGIKNTKALYIVMAEDITQYMVFLSIDRERLVC